MQRLAGPTKITATDTSSTLATLTLTLNALTRRLEIIAPTTGIFWTFGTATTSSCPLPYSAAAVALAIEASRADLATLQFVTAAAAIAFWVIEYG